MKSRVEAATQSVTLAAFVGDPFGEVRMQGKISRDALAPLAGRVAFLTQPPVLPTGDDLNLREFVTWRAGRDGALPALMPNDAEAARRAVVGRIAAAASSWPSIDVVDAAAPFYLGDGHVRYAEGRRFLYADDDHLTDAGADEVRGLLAPVISAVIGRR